MKNRICGLSVLLGVLCLLYYAAVVAFGGPAISFVWIWLIAGCFFWLIFILLILDEKKNILKGLPKAVPTVCAIMCVLILPAFLFIFLQVTGESSSAPEVDADYVIVLGAKTSGGHIPRLLKYRLDAAKDYYLEHPDCMLVMSGGQGRDEEVPEALVMRDYLIAAGVPESSIICEMKSTDTDENLEFSYALIKEESQDAADDLKLVICTNSFHVYRALCLARAKDMGSVYALASKKDLRLELHYSVRDTIGVFKELLTGNIGIKDIF